MAGGDVATSGVSAAVAANPTARSIRPIAIGWRALLVALGFSSVASLLGWVYGLASFATLFRWVTLPGALILVLLAVRSAQGGAGGIGPVLTVGAFSGLVGTLAYDLFRVPFIFGGGLLLLSPVESYGVLATGASHSSGWTDFVGWAYHFSNGIGFGIAYAAVALRRHWAWGVLFALGLETGTVLTPFASAYQLDGKYFVIGIAYAAHVPFGLALGRASTEPERVLHLVGVLGRRTAAVAVLGTLVVLAVWLRPGWNDPDVTAGAAVSAGPSLMIQGGRISPEFTVVDPGGCVTVANTDEVARSLTLQGRATAFAPGAVGELCPSAEGVHHLKSSGGLFTGGFLIVDPES